MRFQRVVKTLLLGAFFIGAIGIVMSPVRWRSNYVVF